MGMKTYKIPVTWEAYGEMEIEAESMSKAIKIAEDEETPYPSIDGNVEGSLDVDYGLTEELNKEEMD